MQKIVVLVICIQILIIILVIFNINQKKSEKPVPVILEKEEYTTIPTEEFRYYYEPIPQTVIKEKMPGMSATYKINKDTLHERYDYKDSKEKGTIRIITLGDSFTFGQFVNTEQNWTEVLEDTLNRQNKCKDNKKFEVIILGVGGYDSAYSVKRFERRGLTYNPDIVVWLDAELYRNSEKITQEIVKFKSNLEMRGQSLGSTDYEKLKNEYFKAVEEKMLTGEYKRHEQERISDVILSIKKFFAGKLLLVVLPSSSAFDKDTLRKVASKDEGIYLIENLRNIYNEGAFFVGDGHPNKKGHMIIAEDIAGYLRQFPEFQCGE